MAVTLNASTTAGLVTSADTSGNLDLQAGGVTKIAVTSAGAAITGTLSASGESTLTGNVGIGMAPTVPLQIKGGTSNGLNETLKLTAGSTSANSGPSIGFNDYYGTNTYPTWKLGEIGAIYAGGAEYQGALVFYTNTGTTATSTSEKMRIASNGQVQINTTAFTSAAGQVEIAGDGSNVRNPLSINSTTSGTASSPITAWMRNYTYTGGIAITGTTTAYNTSSDYRLKDNVAPMTGALARVALLKPVTYSWKIDGSAGEGFIAHELQEVCPLAVTGEKDAVNDDGSVKSQSIDVSFLVATLTAAIQELKAIVDAQEEQIKVLQGVA